ncbi:hypothetical protein P152DRAFT_342601 [Eremomyces bilateralis CBS 781.70]|uniref:Uncharacterized protein n=1 Tax=Eremomyces bilateralis CBS 781.70 TaxID=1392243 RepID=A0A6G1G3Q7_9PEZI|nr:uncharacterized protein P152DRAFT_342601 [Eremomyces bilateralis CBS 781.70]KAF1812550.1 hypothetical protein P152DRAFT_342601 [Eremomyces bilateralis CBS 781.70]
MALLVLPSEFVAAIMKDVLDTIGLREGTKLRVVCRQFNVFMLNAIYALPAFEGEHEPGLKFFRRDCTMSVRMTAGLILTRMRTGNSMNRPLCFAIKQAVAILTDVPHQTAGTPHTTYFEALATAAARAIPLPRIVRLLSPDCGIKIEPEGSINDAIIAAIYAGNSGLVECLLGRCRTLSAKTQFFGEFLSAAASIGS